MRSALVLLVALSGCEATLTGPPVEGDLAAGPGEDLAVALSDGSAPDLSQAVAPEDLLRPRVGPQTLAFNLDAGVFAPSANPDHPSALVYVPGSFDPTPPINIVVYIHGFNNCVYNIVRDAGGRCSDGGVHNAYSLAAQLESSGKNALLFAPEVAFEQATGNAGNLANPATFAKLLQESLDHLAPVLGARTLADVGQIIVASHSGGYTAAIDIVESNGIVAREVWMFDSLYSSSVTNRFQTWIEQDLGSLYGPYRRFGTFYTILDPNCNGTDCNSNNLATQIKADYPPDAGVVIDERSSAVTWSDDVYRHGFLNKHSSLAHDSIPRYYFEILLRTSNLPNK
jgi:hypothetical protein